MSRKFILLLLLIWLGGLVQVQAEVLKDPMQPPAYALKKYRLAKIKARQGTQVGRVKAAAKKKAQQKKSATKTMELSSILVSPARSIAIIDNRMLAVGDSINGARLIKITKANVRLLKKGKVISLSLGQELPAIKKLSVGNKL